MLILVILVIIIILLILLYLNINTNESFENDGFFTACNELSIKREFLYTYIKNLRNPVQDLSDGLVNAYMGKQENMAFQQTVKQVCKRDMNDNCKGLASVDAGVFKVLPDVDMFYYNLLYSGPDLDNLLQQLNYYSAMIGCNTKNIDGNLMSDPSNTHLNMNKDIGIIDVETLSTELEKLSPYYLSPEVVRYLLRFLISKEQLGNLHDSVETILNNETKVVKNILQYFS